MTIDELNAKFASDVATFEPGTGGLPRLAIKAKGGTAHVYLHGAHVTHFQPAGGEPMLFLSPKSFFEKGKAIRGGVPVVFPWFGPRDGDKTAMHGVVRTREWTLDSIERAGDEVKASFSIASSLETRAIWNGDFQLRFIVAVGPSLEMVLEVKNTSQQEFRFEEMLHTYMAVGDVRQVSVMGLTGSQYTDKNNLGPEKRLDEAKPMTFKGPTDRVYLNTAATCVVTDPVLKRKLVVEKENSNSTVVWNPWSDRIGSFVDMQSADWPKFLCVESCNVWDNGITIQPGAMHTLRVRLRAEAM